MYNQQMNKLSKKTSITLVVFHLPILVVLLVIAGLGVGSIALSKSKIASNKPVASAVLSDEDDRDEVNKPEDNDTENSDEDNRDQDSQKVKTDDDEKEVEDKDDENKLQIEDKKAEVSSVTNADGTVTKTSKKVDGNEVKTILLTYDQNGILIKKVKLNSDGTVKEEELIDKDTENEIEDINQEEDNEFELTFKPSTNGAVDSALGNIIKAKLKQEIRNEDGLGVSVNKVELEVKTAQGTVKYKGTALKSEKLFGLFGVEVPVDLEIDPITGKIISINQGFWAKILDFFSL